MKTVAPAAVVLDASTALAWCFPDEASQYADDVLAKLEGITILAPAVWGLEIANAILTGERKKRLKAPEIRLFADLLEALPIVEDRQSVRGSASQTSCRWRADTTYPLTMPHISDWPFDAGAQLATLDAKLARAAKKTGIRIFSADRS